MKIGIFTEFGPEYGYGNYSRMRSLVYPLIQNGAQAVFIVDDKLKNEVAKDFAAIGVGDFIRSPLMLDIGVFDYPAKIYDKAKDFIKFCTKTVLIDDNALNASSGNLLINYNLHAKDLDYSNYKFDKLLLGPKYSLIRRQFSQNSRITQNRDEFIITFGGGYTGELGIRVAENIVAFHKGIINLVIGGSIEAENLNLPRNVRVWKNADLAPIMQRSWLYIGGAGVTLLEAISSGLSLVVAPVAKDQVEVCKALSKICDAAVCSDICLDEIICENNANIIANAVKLQLQSEHRTRYKTDFEPPNGNGSELAARAILALKE